MSPQAERKTPAPPSSAPDGGPVRRLFAALAVTALDAALLVLALGGVAALLGHTRALALIAVWGAGAVVLALLRPVRSHDPVEVRPDASAMVALFLIPLVVPALSAYGERIGVWNTPGGSPLRWLGVALAAAGYALRIGAMAQLGSRFSPLVAVQRSHSLETSGIYSRVRHPGYFGAWLAALGAALAFGSALALPLVALMLAVLWSRVRREEALLERHFGDEYRRYRKRTGAFLPRLLSPRNG